MTVNEITFALEWRFDNMKLLLLILLIPHIILANENNDKLIDSLMVVLVTGFYWD